MSALDDLLLSLAGVPSLPGARCRGRRDGLFDGTDGPTGDKTRQAARVCRGCPALERCRKWADSQPDSGLDGVIGGRLYTYASRASLRRHDNGIEIAE